jgi:hypothetical protein
LYYMLRLRADCYSGKYSLTRFLVSLPFFVHINCTVPTVAALIPPIAEITIGFRSNLVKPNF